MDLHHTFTVPADVDVAWATLMDLEGVAGCFPGAAVTSVEESSFTGNVKVKLGPIALMYTGSGTFVERDDAAHRAVIDAKGKDKRGNGTAGATVTLEVAAAPDGGAAVDVTTDLNVTGKPAQFGRGVMQDVSDKLLGQFVSCLEKRFADGDVPATADGDGVDGGAAETPSAAEAPAVPAKADGPPAPPGTSPPPTVTPTPAARPAARPASRPTAQDDSLDLGATVLPVLLRSYAPHVAVGVVALVVGIAIGRARGR